MKRFELVVLLSALAVAPAGVEAQQSVPGFENGIADRQQAIGDRHFKLIGSVELKQRDTELYADEVEVFTDQDRAIATGNVVLVQGANRIAAERAEFNTRTKLGTFYQAYGFATVKPQTSRPGAIAPTPVSSQENDVYFYGDVIEKVGLRKYKITNGGFSTCVQPTPRWMLSSKTTVLNLDHYTLLRDAVFTVKGVPLLYTPILYYPTNEEDRATGLLIPTYGSSKLRGHSIHNEFFWAIDRSQDAAFLHDWFSKTGQGFGSEYRYNFGGGSDGNLRTYLLNEDNTANVSGGVPVTATRSYEIRGAANQLLPGRLRARASVDYFSSIATQQTFNVDYYNAYRNQRAFGGNVVGSWRVHSLNATLDHREYFSSQTSSAVYGSWPRISFSRNERQIAGTPLYFSAGSEYASFLKSSRDGDIELSNQDVTRLDFTPQVRFPFKRWQWFTVNSSLAWRDTYYTRSLASRESASDPAFPEDEGLNRRFFTLQAQMLGPVFTRVWDTPGNGYAEKFKHSVEPFMNIQRTSSIDNFNQIIQIDGTDTIVGGTTSYSYGVNNRFYAKRRIGSVSQAREILDVRIAQTYYSDQRAAQYDPGYSSSFSSTAANNFSPILITARGVPGNDLNAQMSVEIDSRYLALRQISAGGSYSWTGRVQTNANWSKKAFIPELDGFNDRNALNQSINASANLHARDNRVGGIYSFSYDMLQSRMLQQRVSGFYNAQCCGLALEFQTFNFGGITSGLSTPSDRRFFLSFSLGGLANFSPFNGAMGGVPR